MCLGDLGKPMAGVAKLAEVGLHAITAVTIGGFIAGVVGLVCFALWIWNHVSIGFH